MQNLPEDQCARSMEFFRNQVTCEWCHHPRELVMTKTRLCKHCNRIRLELRRRQARNEAFQQQHGGLTYIMHWEAQVQQAMVEDAQFEGRLYGHFFDDDLIPLGLEHEFRWLSERFVLKDFFNGMANELNHGFSLNQRRFVFYLLSLMNREWMRRNRRRNAMGAVMRHNLENPARERPHVTRRLAD